MVKYLSRRLVNRGYKVSTAFSGREALAAIEKDHTYDLVILDVMMPRMSGYEVCEKIRRVWSTYSRSEAVYKKIRSNVSLARTRAGLRHFHPNAFNLYIAHL